MDGILIDYNTIAKDILKKHFPIPQELEKQYINSDPGLVIIIPKTIKTQLESLPQGDKRVSFINNKTFIKNIKEHYFVYYNNDMKLCLLSPEQCHNMSIVLNTLLTGLPSDTKLWIPVRVDKTQFTKLLEHYAEFGFNSPYVTEYTPVKTNIPLTIALSKFNTKLSPNNNTVYEAKDVLKQKDSKSCLLYAQFSPQAITFLKKTSKLGITKNKDGSSSQKELSGDLTVSKIKNENNKFIYIISLNEKNVSSGSEEEVNVSPTRYNFHSHPEEAYVRHSVDKAWPSVTDYLGYLSLGTKTIFHCVATIEGIYIMSFGKYWMSKLDKVNKNFIKNNFNIDHKEKYTPEEYTSFVNKILYKNNPIYHVEFIPWNNASKIFSVNYSKVGLNCLSTEKSMNNFREIHE